MINLYRKKEGKKKMNKKTRKIVTWITLFIMVAGVAATIVGYAIRG